MTTICLPVCASKLEIRSLSSATVPAENIPAWSCTYAVAAAGSAAESESTARPMAAPKRAKRRFITAPTPSAAAKFRGELGSRSPSIAMHGRAGRAPELLTGGIAELRRGARDLDRPDRAEHDADLDRALHVRARRQRHVAGLRLRRHDVDVRCALHQSVRAPVGCIGLHVSLRRRRARSQCRCDRRLVFTVGVRFRRRSGAGRDGALREPARRAVALAVSRRVRHRICRVAGGLPRCAGLGIPHARPRSYLGDDYLRGRRRRLARTCLCGRYASGEAGGRVSGRYRASDCSGGLQLRRIRERDRVRRRSAASAGNDSARGHRQRRSSRRCFS